MLTSSVVLLACHKVHTDELCYGVLNAQHAASQHVTFWRLTVKSAALRKVAGLEGLITIAMPPITRMRTFSPP